MAVNIVEPLRIALLAPYSEKGIARGGAERHIHNLVEHLSYIDNLEVHIFFLSKNMDAKSKLHNVTLHPLRKSKLPVTISGITISQIRLVRAVRKLNPDIVHAQMIGAPYGMAATLLSREYPTITTVHTMTFQTSNIENTMKERIHDRIWIWLEPWEAKKINRFIIVSSNLKEELTKMGAKSITIIPNGIEKKWFEFQYTPVENRIFCVGRFQKIKGQDILLTAFRILKDKIPNATLHLAGAIFGRDEYISSLKSTAKQLGIEKDVSFLVDIDDEELIKEYRECSVFVLPSMEESHPIVLLEAMASKRPVVATRVGGVPDMIDDGQSGFLVKYGNHDELQDRIFTLLTNKELRERIGEAGRKRVANLDWANIAKKTYQEYLNTINNYKWERNHEQ